MSNLRESQQDATNHPQVNNHVDDQASTLGIQIAGQNWLVDMLDISGVLPLPTLTMVPLTKPWFLGIVNVRGMLYGVTDMAAYQQNGKASGTPANRILLVAERHAFNAALLVDCVLGLRNPRVWTQDEVQGRIQYHDEQGNLWRKLEVVDLLGQSAFLQISV